MTVIDVSENNGAVNWTLVSTHCDGAIIRVGYRGWGSGSLMQDTRALENLRGAAQNGVPAGIYFVTQAITEAEAAEEAQYCANVAELAGVNLSLPICYDDELAGGANGKGRRDMLTRAERTNTAIAFCRAVQELGFTPMLYCSDDWYTHMLGGDTVRQAGALVWIASYPVGPGRPYVPPTVEWDAWQYSPYERFPGIGTECDASHFKQEDGERMTSKEFERRMQEYRKALQENAAGPWSQVAREWAVETGLVQGGSDGAYMWQDFMTREQLVTVLHRFARQMGKA